MKGLGWLAILAMGALGGARPGASSWGGGGSLPPTPARTDSPVRPGWLSFDDIVRVALSAGFPPDRANAAARIAWRESQGNPGAARVVTAAQAPALRQLPERSFGLWQVNVLAFPQYDEGLLRDPEYAARAVFELSKGGSDWRPWRVR